LLSALSITICTVTAAALSGTTISSAQAQSFQPAIVFDMGGKFDKSFNEAAYVGAERFKKETGIEYREFEVTQEAQREQALRTMARRGANVVVGVGFAQASAMEKVSQEYPDTKFCIIDSVVERPNVQSITFKEHEGSFLVGMMAALASRTGKVGFVGGMDIPLIRKFACGYVLGVKAAKKDAQVFQNMTGTTGAAWNDPVKGGELAKSQIDRGADVVYHAAGGTGIGVLRAVADAGKLGIGVDSNQNMLHPGKVLTSMVKRVDVATHTAFAQARDQNWGGHRVLGLKEDGVAWADDEHNKALITAEMRNAVETAAADIKDGKIQVHDYMADGKCAM
jgi:basic membrane protein A and related proteins